MRSQTLLTEETVLMGLLFERTIECCPAPRPYGASECGLDISTRAHAEYLSCHFSRTLSDTAPQIAGIDPQLLSFSVAATDEQVHIRVLGLVMIDGNPFSGNAKISINHLHQSPNERREFYLVFWRHDNLEEMRVRSLPFPEGAWNVAILTFPI